MGHGNTRKNKTTKKGEEAMSTREPNLKKNRNKWCIAFCIIVYEKCAIIGQINFELILDL